MSDIILHCTTELAGAILLNEASPSELSSFCTAPSEFLLSYDLDIGDLEISVVENDLSSVHLCLPFYSGLSSISSEFISDRDLSDISGGEFVFYIAAGAIATGVVSGLLTAAGVAIANRVLSDQGRNLDGSAFTPEQAEQAERRRRRRGDK